MLKVTILSITVLSGISLLCNAHNQMETNLRNIQVVFKIHERTCFWGKCQLETIDFSSYLYDTLDELQRYDLESLYMKCFDQPTLDLKKKCETKNEFSKLTNPAFQKYYQCISTQCYDDYYCALDSTECDECLKDDNCYSTLKQHKEKFENGMCQYVATEQNCPNTLIKSVRQLCQLYYDTQCLIKFAKENIPANDVCNIYSCPEDKSNPDSTLNEKSSSNSTSNKRSSNNSNSNEVSTQSTTNESSSQMKLSMVLSSVSLIHLFLI